MKKRIGYYCWAGPGIIRMTNLKFFHPKIDIESVMGSYDYDYLARVKEKFGITDVWATYSWGFSDKTEKEDRDFLISKLPNFKKLGLKVHAYIQGTNLVTSEFPNVDWYSKDQLGRFITYYRGRRSVCLNNPGFVEYIAKKTQGTQELELDGIYIDNPIMGQMPLPVFVRGLPYVFTGCRCDYCQSFFKEETGEEIPIDFEKNYRLTTRYLQFRTDSLTRFIENLSGIVHSQGREFGTNSLDPKYDPHLMYGMDIGALDAVQDYILFENWALPSRVGHKNNDYIDKLSQKLTKPVFLLSYKYGVGMDSAFSQKDFNAVYSEGVNKHFNICIKGSEYVTRGVWHNLYVEKYDKPQVNQSLHSHPSAHLGRLKRFKFTIKYPLLKSFMKRFYNPLFTIIMEDKRARRAFFKFAKWGMWFDRSGKEFVILYKRVLGAAVIVGSFIFFSWKYF